MRCTIPVRGTKRWGTTRCVTIYNNNRASRRRGEGTRWNTRNISCNIIEYFGMPCQRNISNVCLTPPSAATDVT